MAIERIVPGTIEWEAFYANHISRYEFAQKQLSDRRASNVLDAACGVGYGSCFLGKNNNLFITGIDQSTEALEVANKNFSKQNIRFLKDDCHTLEAASEFGLFDAIVSFETLEHLPKPDVFLKSCYSNLKPGGMLIISTPNQLVSSPDGKLDWEYHEKEYSPAELAALLLRAGFISIDIFGQQLTAIGILRDQFRAELNRINSNPFIRLGKKIQQVFRGRKFTAVLPEQSEDFEIRSYKTAEEITQLEKKGPFVLIATCKKP